VIADRTGIRRILNPLLHGGPDLGIRGTVRTVANRFGYDIVPLRRRAEHKFDLLGLLVEKGLAAGSNFRFMQVGANDGLRADPLHHLVVRYRLSGILIEPLPDFFSQLKANYSGSPQLEFENCAVAARDGVLPFYRIRADAPVPDAAHGLGSFDRSNLTSRRQGIPGLDAFIEEVKVPAKTVATLRRQYGIEYLSLLVVDAEGFDADVVRSVLASGLRPEVIVYEHVHLSPRTHDELAERLASGGYALLETAMDVYAVRSELFDAR
jgi:FkbM family methyltransferase